MILVALLMEAAIDRKEPRADKYLFRAYITVLLVFVWEGEGKLGEGLGVLLTYKGFQSGGVGR